MNKAEPLPHLQQPMLCMYTCWLLLCTNHWVTYILLWPWHLHYDLLAQQRGTYPVTIVIVTLTFNRHQSSDHGLIPCQVWCWSVRLHVIVYKPLGYIHIVMTLTFDQWPWFQIGFILRPWSITLPIMKKLDPLDGWAVLLHTSYMYLQTVVSQCWRAHPQILLFQGHLWISTNL